MSLQRNHYKWLGLMIALFYPVMMSIAGRLRSSRVQIPAYPLPAYFLLYAIPFVILLSILKYGEKEKLSSLGSIEFKPETLWLGLLIMLCNLGAVMLLGAIMLLLHITPPQEPQWNIMLQWPLWARLLLVVWAGISEEIYFRGYGITRLQQLTNNKWIATILPLFLFAIYHVIFGTLYHVVFAFVGGIVLTVSYLKFKNLLANMIGHSMFDLLFIVSLPHHS